MSRAIALRLAALQRRRKAAATAWHEARHRSAVEYSPRTGQLLYEDGTPLLDDDPRSPFDMMKRAVRGRWFDR